MLQLLTMLALLMPPQVDEQKLFIELDISSQKETCIYDPIFVRTSIRNESNQAIKLRLSTTATSSYRLSRDGYTFTYPHRFPQEFVSSPKAAASIPPGRKLLTNHRILGTPPVNQVNHSFWESPSPLSLQAIFFEFPREYHSLLGPSHTASSGSSLKLKARPEQEMSFLNEIFRKAAAQHHKLHLHAKHPSLNKDPLESFTFVDLNEMNLMNFGLDSINDRSLQEELLAYEDKLSKGTLRDIVYLTNRLREMARETDESQQTEMADQLLTWLDSLPEIQREVLADRIIRNSRLIRNDKPAFHHLFHECISRTPEEYSQFTNYREYLVSEYGNTHLPGYQRYLQEKKQAEK